MWGSVVADYNSCSSRCEGSPPSFSYPTISKMKALEGFLATMVLATIPLGFCRPFGQRAAARNRQQNAIVSSLSTTKASRLLEECAALKVK